MEGFSPVSQDEVRVFWLDLDVDAGLFDDLQSILSDDEHQRVLRFNLPLLQRRATVRYARRRQVLSELCDVDTSDIVLHRDENGRPIVSSPDPTLTISMSHSNDLGVFAVGRSRNLGVDIESLAEVMRAEDVIARILTEHERLSLAPLSPDERGKEFLTLWTRKEAYLKATGMGIGQGVQDVKVPMLVELRGERVQPEVGGESFFFYDLQCPVPEFSASLVIAPASDTLARPQVTQSRR